MFPFLNSAMSSLVGWNDMSRGPFARGSRRAVCVIVRDMHYKGRFAVEAQKLLEVSLEGAVG